MIRLHTLIMNLKREFWENSRMVLLLPLIVSGMMLLAAIGAVIYSNVNTEVANKSVVSVEKSVDVATVELDSKANKTPTHSDKKANKKPTNDKPGKSDFWYMGIYFSLAWLVATFYLLSSLHSDRRDNSVLFWKSMPVSEWESVVSKYLFASMAFTFFTMLIAWGNSLLLYGLVASGVSPTVIGGDDEAGVNFLQLFVLPLIVVGTTWLWSAMWFSWALFCSARAKRSPILLFILMPVLLRGAERIITRDSALFDFFMSHSPWHMLMLMSAEPSMAELLDQLYLENIGSLLMSLLIAAGLLYAAVWHRTYRFEKE